MKYGMVFDLKRCVGCNSCTVACKQVNGVLPGAFRTKVVISEEGTYPNVRLKLTPHICMHCENPECVRVCPTGASMKLDNGIVVVDKEKCIGCQYCIMACPYQARTFTTDVRGYFPNQPGDAYEKNMLAKHVVGEIDKCDFCLARLEAGKKPACVATCGPKARIFGDLDDPASEISYVLKTRDATRMLPHLGLNPSVYYVTM